MSMDMRICTGRVVELGVGMGLGIGQRIKYGYKYRGGRKPEHGNGCILKKNIF